jgi:hypothetical protein
MKSLTSPTWALINTCELCNYVPLKPQTHSPTIITIENKNTWPKHLKPIVKLGNANQVQEIQECWQSSGNWLSKMNLWIKHITWKWEKNKVEQKTKKKNAKFTWTCKTPRHLCITWKHHCKAKKFDYLVKFNNYIAWHWCF